MKTNGRKSLMALIHYGISQIALAPLMASI